MGYDSISANIFRPYSLGCRHFYKSHESDFSDYGTWISLQISRLVESTKSRHSLIAAKFGVPQAGVLWIRRPGHYTLDRICTDPANIPIPLSVRRQIPTIPGQSVRIVAVGHDERLLRGSLATRLSHRVLLYRFIIGMPVHTLYLSSAYIYTMAYTAGEIRHPIKFHQVSVY